MDIPNDIPQDALGLTGVYLGILYILVIKLEILSSLYSEVGIFSRIGEMGRHCDHY